MKTVFSPTYSEAQFKAGIITILTEYSEGDINTEFVADLCFNLSVFVRDICNKDLILCSTVPDIKVFYTDGGKLGVSCTDPLINDLLKELFDE